MIDKKLLRAGWLVMTVYLKVAHVRVNDHNGIPYMYLTSCPGAHFGPLRAQLRVRVQTQTVPWSMSSLQGMAQAQRVQMFLRAQCTNRVEL